MSRSALHARLEASEGVAPGPRLLNPACVAVPRLPFLVPAWAGGRCHIYSSLPCHQTRGDSGTSVVEFVNRRRKSQALHRLGSIPCAGRTPSSPSGSGPGRNGGARRARRSQPRARRTPSMAAAAARMRWSDIATPNTDRPTGALPGAWQGSDTAQPSRKSAGHAPGLAVPGILRRAVVGVEPRGAEGELDHVGAPDKHRARGTQPRDGSGIGSGLLTENF